VVSTPPLAALGIWEVSANPVVVTRRIAWPELVTFSRALTALRAPAVASSAVARAFAAAAATRRLLCSTPLPPTHPAIGLKAMYSEIELYLTAHPDHVAAEVVRQLRHATDGLMASRSPLAVWAGEEVSRYGHDNELSRPEALIIVPRHEMAAPVRCWLAEEDLHADVLTAGEARSCVPYRAALLAGHPGYTYASPWRDPQTALRYFGWLLTAPPAATAHIALPGDTPALDENAAWLLPGDAHPRPRSADPGPPPSGRTWSAPLPAPRIVQPATGETGLDVALGTPVILAGPASVYYHPQLGPRPHGVLLDDETGALRITATAVQSLRPGTLLVLRVGLAEHTELVERADRWLAERRAWPASKITAARQLIATIRSRLAKARDERGSEAVQRELVLKGGVDGTYARALVTSPLDDYYICPQRRPGYVALLRVLSLERHDDQFEVLATVRSAHQQAGEEIRRDLLARLEVDRAWVDRVDEHGWTQVTLNGHGHLLLAAIAAIGDTALPVPRTLLGVPLDKAGYRIRRLPEIGGAE
jgi:hypothetical protein